VTPAEPPGPGRPGVRQAGGPGPSHRYICSLRYGNVNRDGLGPCLARGRPMARARALAAARRARRAHWHVADRMSHHEPSRLRDGTGTAVRRRKRRSALSALRHQSGERRCMHCMPS
jgi:hypothetical protein